MANVDQKNLIPLCILEVLRKYSDESHPLTHNMIIEHLVKDYNISPPPERKSIGRNLENLRSQMEIDIEITPKGSYLVSREFEDYELRLLIDSVLSNKYISVIETRELVDKLKSLSGVYFDSYEEHLLTIDEKKKTDKRDLYLKLHIINDAIENGRDLCFELTENAEYPDWLLTRSYIEGFGNDTYDDDDELDRSAQIKPEYLVLMNNRYYVAFKAIILVNLGGDLVEELAYCGLDEMTNLSTAEHKPVILPKERSLLKRVEVSEDTVREMASRGVIERPGSNRIRADFLIDPPLKNKVAAAMGEPVIITEYPGLFPQVRVVIDVDRNTFERFWWNHLTEIRLLGPEFEITWLRSMLVAAQESISDTDALRKKLGIENSAAYTRPVRNKNTRKRFGKIYPEKKILNERISSNEYESEVHVFGSGYEMMTHYNLRAELEIEDEGHVVYLYGAYDNMRYALYLWVTAESLFQIEEDNEEIYGETAKKCNMICDEGVEKYFPGTDPADRYADMAEHMVKILQERIKEDNHDYELTENNVEWERFYYDEERTEPFDPDKIYEGIDLQDLLNESHK